MKQKDLNHVWAWSRVEAMADGSLDRGDARRMHDAMRRDAELAAAVQRAAAVRRTLARLPQARVPRDLLGRLLAVPASRGQGRNWSWAAVPAAVALVAVAAVALYGNRAAENEAARLAAVQEFNIAMYYLQKSVAITNERVEDEVGSGLLGALAATQSHLANEQDDETGG